MSRAATKLEPVRIVHISVGGPLLYMPLSSKRGITFEDHRIFGPVPCYPNGEPRKNGVRPQSPFWDLYEAWCKAGKPVVNGTNQCDMRHATPEQPR